MEIQVLKKIAGIYKFAAFVSKQDAQKYLSIIDSLLDPADAAQFKSFYIDVTSSDDEQERQLALDSLEEFAEQILQTYAERDVTPEFISKLSDAIDKSLEIIEEYSIEESFDSEVESARHNVNYDPSKEIAVSDGTQVSEDIYKRRERQKAQKAERLQKFRDKVNAIHKKYDASRIGTDKRKQDVALNNKKYRYIKSYTEDHGVSREEAEEVLEEKIEELLTQKINSQKASGATEDQIKEILNQLKSESFNEAISILGNKPGRKKVVHLTPSESNKKTRLKKLYIELSESLGKKIEPIDVKNKEELDALESRVNALKEMLKAS